jgi:hypothetical protein
LLNAGVPRVNATEREKIQKAAAVYAYVLAVFDMDSRFAPAYIRMIFNIIVDEACVVGEFQQGRERKAVSL